MYTIYKITSDNVVDFAAEEFKKYLRMMMPDCNDIAIRYDENAKDGFRLGLMQHFGLDTSEAEDTVLDDVIHIDAQTDGGIIAGSNPRSVLMAVYRYLQECGCRWLYPGIDGEYIPITDIRPVKYHKMADRRFRGFCNEGAESQQCMIDTIDFNAKLGMNVYMIEFDIPYTYYNKYYSHSYNTQNRQPEPVPYEQVLQWKRMCETEIAKRGLQFHDMGHGWTAEPFGLSSTKGWEKTELDIPDDTRKCLAQINGVRETWGGVALNTNLCMSNPKVRTVMAESIADYAKKHVNVDFLHVWLADGSRNHCECENCAAMRPSDWYLMIMNELDEILTKEGLETRIVFISYVDTMWAPEKITIKNPKRFSLLYAPITRTYTESAGKDTPTVKPLPYIRNGWETPKTSADSIALLREWKRNWTGPCFSYEYHFWRHQYFDPTTLAIAKCIYNDVQGLEYIGVDGFVEDGSQRSFFPNGFAVYTFARSLFDRSLSFESITEDYFSHVYGDDWKDVLRYLEKLSDVFDFAYMSGEKSEDGTNGKYYNPTQANKLHSVAEIVKEGYTLANQHAVMPTRPQTVSYRLLKLHAEYCEGLAKAVAEKAKGNSEKALELMREHIVSFGKYEHEIERYYDHYLASITMFRRLCQEGNKTVIQF